MTQYYKVLRNDMTHNRFKYQLGLNIDSQPFDNREYRNGLHFADEKNICKWLYCGDQLAYVSIPPDAQTVHFLDNSKADKLIIDKIIPLAEWHVWEDPEFCLATVQQNWYALKYVKDQTEEICLAAVRQYGCSLEYVKEQTPVICLAAVQQDGDALKYVKEQTDDICLAAVQQDGLALYLVHNKAENICLEAVKQCGYAIKYVANQTLEICLAAVKKNEDALYYVETRFASRVISIVGTRWVLVDQRQVKTSLNKKI